MSFNVEIPGFKNQKIELKSGAFSNSLLVNGKAAPKYESSKTDYRVTDDAGTEQRVTLKGQALDLPIVEYNGETYHFAPPVSTGKKVLAGVLLVPLFAGGAVGGGLAGAGFMIALQAYRSNKPDWIQHLTALGVAVGAWVIYLFIAGGVQTLLG
jgi:hypothetical protein